MMAKQRQIDDQVRAFYEQQHPSDSLVASLTSLVEHPGHGKCVDQSDAGLESSGCGCGAQQARQRHNMISRKWIVALAACLLLAIGTSIVAWQLHDLSRIRSAERLYAIASEIASDHRKQRQPVFHGSNYEHLSRRLTKLGFSLASPRRLDNTPLRLEGGRYCSIGDQPAAQLKLRHVSGTSQTLYQAAVTKQLRPVKGQPTFVVDQIEVLLWTEGGLFFGLARDVVQP